MQLNEISFRDSRPIDGYGPGFFRIGGEVLRGAVLVHATGAGAWGGFEDVAAVLNLADTIDVLLVGTGAEIAHLPPAFRTAIEGSDTGLEPMNSPAACRTYNVLLAEGRRVAVALLPV